MTEQEDQDAPFWPEKQFVSVDENGTITWRTRIVVSETSRKPATGR